MRVFVTGATGFVGSAVVKELINSGHQVLGLSRSDANTKLLTELGAEVHLGSLEDLESLKSGAKSSDGVIHAGFIHDFTKFKESCEIDRKVIEALGSALVGTNKPLIITSGIGIISGEELITEDKIPDSTSTNPRIATEEAARSLINSGLNVSLLRLPPSVHGEGDHGFVPMLIDIAREKGISAYIDEGNNRWPAVHRFDAARLYRLALENGTPNSTFHAVDEEGIPFREIAEVIGRQLNIPVVSKTAEEALAHFTWFSHFAKLSCPASSKVTQEKLGWKPVEIGLINDIDSEKYFKV